MRKLIGTVVLAVFGIGLVWGATEYWGRMNEKPPLVYEEQAVSGEVPRKVTIEEVYALCEEYQLGCEAKKLSVPDGVKEMSMAEIRTRYGEEWEIEEEGSEVVIRKRLPGLCEAHKGFYHLGVNSSGEYLTLCYGPAVVGSNGGVVVMTDILLSELEEGEREKVLEGYYESTSLDEMQGILDGFCEEYEERKG